MKIFLAAYTSPASGELGYRWIWKDPGISDSLLNSLYSSVSTSIPDVSILLLDDLAAGVITPEKERVAIYRFLNGGRDAIGREGRFFLICGIADISDAPSVDLRELFDRPEFCTVRDIRPASTFIECASSAHELTLYEIGYLKENHTLELSGPSCMSKAMYALNISKNFADTSMSITGKMDNVLIKIKTQSRSVAPTPITPQSMAKDNSLETAHIPLTKTISKRTFLYGFISGFIACLLIVIFILWLRHPSKAAKPVKSEGTNEIKNSPVHDDKVRTLKKTPSPKNENESETESPDNQ